jgi:hypothetical protein
VVLVPGLCVLSDAPALPVARSGQQRDRDRTATIRPSGAPPARALVGRSEAQIIGVLREQEEL